MRWLSDWWRAWSGRHCPPAEAEVSEDRQDAAHARAQAEQALADAKRQGPEVSAVAGRLRRVRGDDFARLMTDAMRGT